MADGPDKYSRKDSAPAAGTAGQALDWEHSGKAGKTQPERPGLSDHAQSAVTGQEHNPTHQPEHSAFEFPSLHNVENEAASLGLQAGYMLFEQYAKMTASKPTPVEKHPLYGDGDKSINAKGVVQGDVNDCFFFASLASVADCNPDVIKKAIKKNSDGSFDVTFPKAVDGKPVHVAPLTEQELLTYGRETSSGTWPAVMEKAFGTYLHDHPGERDKFIQKKEEPGVLASVWNWLTSDGHEDDVQRQANFGRTPPVLELLTGFAPGGRPLGPQQNPDAVAGDLAQAFSVDRKLPTVAAINETNQIALDRGLRPGHAYSVIGYSNGVVTLRDPTGQTGENEAGKSVPSDHGVFNMSVQDFTKTFDELAIDQMRSPYAGSAVFMGPRDFLKR